MLEFTQVQAALLSRYDERSFRSLIDKRIILPSPATRNFGRGKLKTFMRDEVRFAAILRHLDIGLTTFQQAGVTDWIRKNLAGVLHLATKENPPYIILEVDIEGDGWNGDFRTAYGDYRSGDTPDSDRKISILIGEGEDKRPLRRFMAANVLDALWWDDDEIIANIFRDPAQEGEAEA